MRLNNQTGCKTRKFFQPDHKQLSIIIDYRPLIAIINRCLIALIENQPAADIEFCVLTLRIYCSAPAIATVASYWSVYADGQDDEDGLTLRVPQASLPRQNHC
jgi:hypothetical protein